MSSIIKNILPKILQKQDQQKQQQQVDGVIVNLNKDDNAVKNDKIGSGCNRYGVVNNVAVTRQALEKEQPYVRILLFRECESKGRKLLFDSSNCYRGENCKTKLSEHNPEWNEQSPPLTMYNGDARDAKAKNSIMAQAMSKSIDDVSNLGEMIFGTVAMTFKGPSFKIHTIESPKCIMCSKIFPYSEYSLNMKNRKYHSSSSSSTSSSTSSQSSSSTDSSNFNHNLKHHNNYHALLSLKSAHINNEAYDQNIKVYRLKPIKRSHKISLGIAVIMQFNDSNLNEYFRVLEHIGIFPRILDRLHYKIANEFKKSSKNMGPKFHSIIFRFINQLKCLISNITQKQDPLIWHNLLLHSIVPVKLNVIDTNHILEKMCTVLDNFDTKDTNFFISNLLTAFLMHHLGWVHIASEKFFETVKSNFYENSNNPFQYQLKELYGALSTPIKIAKTLITGDCEKSEDINSILKFLSFFLRSSLIKKQYEIPSSFEEDVIQAKQYVEKAFKTNPALITASTIRKSNKKITKYSKHEYFEISKSDEFIKQEFLIGHDTVDSNANVSSEFANADKEFKFSNLSDSASFKESLEIPIMNESCNSDSKLTASKSSYRGFEDTFHEESDQSSGSEDIPDNSKLSEDIQKIENENVSKKLIDGKSGFITNFVNDKKFQVEDLSMVDIEKMLTTSELHADFIDSLKPGQSFTNLDFLNKSLHNTFADTTVALPITITYDKSINQFQKSTDYCNLNKESNIKQPIKSIRERLQSACQCECAYTFTRIPSSSAELPEGILRKIIQRNFPESSKNLPFNNSYDEARMCSKCRKGYNEMESSSRRSFENGKLFLETPTNATEMMKGCGPSTSKSPTPDSLEALLEANFMIELPMPRSKKTSPQSWKDSFGGFASALINTTAEREESNIFEMDYNWGSVIQGFCKKKKVKRKTFINQLNVKKKNVDDNYTDNWWRPLIEELNIDIQCPIINESISDSLCIVGDIDTWQVNVLSSNSLPDNIPVPIGMSGMVSNMLEAFALLWRKFYSTEQCILLLEGRLQEIWMKSKVVAKLLCSEQENWEIDRLLQILDLDMADLPLLLSVATTHSPQITGKIGSILNKY